MLVLTRKPQEKIQIGDNITITVIKTKGKTVRLGIEAPSDVNVLRGELTFDVESNETDEAKEVHQSRTAQAHNRIEKVLGEQECTSASPDDGFADEQAQTQFVRASRSRIKTLLPELLGDAGPLREMLERRAELL